MQLWTWEDVSPASEVVRREENARRVCSPLNIASLIKQVFDKWQLVLSMRAMKGSENSLRERRGGGWQLREAERCLGSSEDKALGPGEVSLPRPMAT